MKNRNITRSLIDNCTFEKQHLLKLVDLPFKGADILETPCDDLEKTTDTVDNANSTHDLDNSGLEGADILETPNDLEKSTDTVDNTNSTHDLDNIGLEGADNISETPCDDLEKTTDTVDNTNSTHDLDNIRLERADNISENPDDDLEVISGDDDDQDPTYKPYTGNLMMDSDSELDGSYSDIYPARTETTVGKLPLLKEEKKGLFIQKIMLLCK